MTETKEGKIRLSPLLIFSDDAMLQ